ncbi:hypothetical protein BH11BAC3_BH11BAC3_18810 [soil metagenome]
MNKTFIISLFALALFVVGVAVPGCKKQDLKLTTTEDVNIVGYFDLHADSFSLFRQILERTEYAPFLNAYGAYTCFAPTNSGVTAWLTKIGAPNVDGADLNTLKDMVKFHLLIDTITTASFQDGKLPVPTMFGQYLVTGVGFNGGTSSYTINRQALITKSNIKVGNGIIHQLNAVLIPASLSIVKQLEAKPEYSIFVDAIKATGYYDLLNTVDPDTTKRWMTVIAEGNVALADSGINNFQALKARYSQTGDPTLANDSLHMYVAYHILNGIKFLGDIINSTSHETLEPQEVVTVQLINQEVILNQNVFNGVLEKGILVNRIKSDNAATNGVWHDATAHFSVKFRKPTAVYWDVCTFPEIVKLPSYYGKQNYDFVRISEADDPLSEITWGWGSNAGTNVLSYLYSSASSITNYACNADIMKFPLGLPARPTYLEFTTPPVIKGKYKIWMCYRQQKQSSSSNNLCSVSVNGDLLSRTFNFTDTRPAGTDAELEAIGWKRYTENTGSVWASRLVGTYDFKTTQRHKLRITNLVGTQNNNNLDMIHIIPVDEDQVLPRFLPDGSKLYQ